MLKNKNKLQYCDLWEGVIGKNSLNITLKMQYDK